MHFTYVALHKCRIWCTIVWCTPNAPLVQVPLLLLLLLPELIHTGHSAPVRKEMKGSVTTGPPERNERIRHNRPHTPSIAFRRRKDVVNRCLESEAPNKGLFPPPPPPPPPKSSSRQRVGRTAVDGRRRWEVCVVVWGGEGAWGGGAEGGDVEAR